MAAFGSSQGGKAKAPETAPQQGTKAAQTDAPKGDKHEPIVPKGFGGSRKGFGA